ncbi:MAG: hypothetical protein E2O56_04325 [Gammaproteobacteria bacterium]|nr:MAG: hypothetical protein E2O56_04325 [Gammaproteobacteria bacterium]
MASSLTLLPAPEKRRPLAIGLLAVLVLGVYALVLHPFVIKHVQLNEQIADQHRALEQFRVLVGQRELYATALQDIDSYQAGNTYYLTETAQNLAAASLQRTVNNAVQRLSDESGCQVISLQNVQSRKEELFPKVTVKVRMRCRMDALRDLLYDLEGSAPLMFIDNVNVYRQRARRRRGKIVTPSHLDVRFDLSAYMRVKS